MKGASEDVKRAYVIVKEVANKAGVTQEECLRLLTLIEDEIKKKEGL